MYLKDTLLYLAQNRRMQDFVVHNKLARKVSHRFVAGEDLESAIEATCVLNQQGIAVALDHLGENVTDEREAHASASSYIQAIERIKQTDVNANISIKLTALGLDISNDLCDQHQRSLLDCARQYATFVCVDMEGSPYTERTVQTTLRMRQQYEQVGTVIQAYLYRSKQDVEQLVEQGVRIRLVKGAYKEPAAIAFQDKSDVDRNYVDLMKLLLTRGNFPAIASQDAAIIDEACSFVRDHGISKDSFEFQMLYGIRHDLQTQLVAKGYNVRVYIPYGSHWYPYLMRRMAERPANLAFVMSNVLR